MKLLSIVFSLFLISAQAQILSPDRIKNRIKERAEQKVENKVNEKVDSGVDKVLDGIFGGIEKGVKNATSSPEKSENTKAPSSTSEEDASQMLSGLLGSLGGSASPASNYSFSASFDMKIQNQEGTEQALDMTMRYYFNKDGKYMANKILDSADPNMKAQLSAMEAVVIDFEQNSVFNFMNMNGQKQMMGISFKPGTSGELAKDSYEKASYTKTNKTKTIAGYSCTGWEMTSKGETSLVWISNASIPFMNGYYKSFNQMNSAVPNQPTNAMAYLQNDELVKMMQNGQMMLGMEMKDNKSTMIMEVLKISPNDSFSFDTAGYSNMMDINAIMKQAQQQAAPNKN